MKVVLKVLPKKIKCNGVLIKSLSEVKMLRLCKHHPFINTYTSAYHSSKNLAILLEYCPFGDLQHYIQDSKL